MVNEVRPGVSIQVDAADGSVSDAPIAGTEGAGASATGAGQPSQQPAFRNPLDWRQFSHELRTPLNAILGNIELLLDGSAGPLSAEARACLGEVQIAGRRLSRQVQILLLWSEVRAGDASRGTSALDLIALVREIWATKRAGALQIKPPNARLPLCGDPFLLQALIGEIVELGSARGGSLPPAIRLENRADGRVLGFAWSGFCAAEVGPLQIALIEAIARLQGAAATLTSKGLCLYWPVAQLPEPQATIRTIDSGRTNGGGGRRSRRRG